MHNKREGFYLPVNFELYPNYLAAVSSGAATDFEVILGNPKYRAVLDKKLPYDYFDNPRTLHESTVAQ